MVIRSKHLKYPLLLILCGFIGLNINAQIVVNSRFKPFTYDELAAPLRVAQQFHDECINTLLNLLETTEQVEAYISREKDPQCWKLYTDCYNSIVDEYNSINKHGTSKGTRGRISNLRRESSSVVNTIINAYNRRINLSNYQSQRLQSNRNITCDKYYLDISLDEFINGNSPSISYRQISSSGY